LPETAGFTVSLNGREIQAVIEADYIVIDYLEAGKHLLELNN
jgi:hypothetical protein